MDKKEALKKIKRGVFFLGEADEKLKADKTIVLESVKLNGLDIKFANKKLKADKSIVIAAVKQNGNALYFAENKIKADKEVVSEAIKNNSEAIRFVDKKLKIEMELLVDRKKKKISSYIFLGTELNYYYETIKKKNLDSNKKITNRLLQFIKSAESNKSSSPVITSTSVEDSDGNVVKLKIKKTGKLIQKPNKDEVIFIFFYYYTSSQYNLIPTKPNKDIQMNIKSFNNEAIVGENPHLAFESESADKPSDTYLQILCDNRQFNSTIDEKRDLTDQFCKYFLK